MNEFLSSQKHCGINFRCLHNHAASIKVHFYKKPSQNLKKKLGQMGENTVKNCHLYAPISQKLFSKSESHLLNAAHKQKTSIAQKKVVHMVNLLTFTINS